MKLNGIFCTNYAAGERFRAVLHSTTADEIKKIDAHNLAVQTDTGEVVETYTIYGKLYSYRSFTESGVFEVEFAQISQTEITAERLLLFMEGLKEGYENE
ncbi:MAG TPA: hypothetical protein PLH00_03255 [Bacteroidaceae bacterium]|jgi:hypothetical protein|nr:hypothetical protein [Bacteroidaceae bacterium]